MRVRAYIDGFNFYYGAKEAIKLHETNGGTRAPWRWLDIEAYCQSVVSRHWPMSTVEVVNYFTARVSARNAADRGPDRQDVYLRALAGRGVNIIPGNFLTKTKDRPLVFGGAANEVLKSRDMVFATVRDTEEKGSDVNLATSLLVDFFSHRVDFDGSLVVSNDSDLAWPVQILRDAGWPVGVINPRRKPTAKLWPKGLAAPHFGARVEVVDIYAAQLPDPATDKAGTPILSGTGHACQRPPRWA
jgi:hypothetical protein